MTIHNALLTAEDLWRLPNDGRRYELHHGVLKEVSPPGNVHGSVAAMSAHKLLEYVQPLGLGAVVSNDPGIVVERGPDHVLAPDVYFITRERIPSGGLPEGYLDVVPDFLIEVVSPSDTAREVQEKIANWLAAGARLVWAAYPRRHAIRAHRSATDVREYGENEVITGEPVLPGFSCRVGDFFG